ncbi:hypothetical protein CEP51_006022 [Fusarium floridanum]|nr:hypothetical protein CEP51_006022 [Fusarium floridanum]
MSVNQNNPDALFEEEEYQPEFVWHVFISMRWELQAPDYPRRQVFVQVRRERLEAARARGLRIPFAFAIDPREAVHGIRFLVIASDPATVIMPVIAWLLNERIQDVESGNLYLSPMNTLRPIAEGATVPRVEALHYPTKILSLFAHLFRNTTRLDRSG